MAIAKGKLLIAGIVGAIGIPYVIHDSKTQSVLNREWKSLTGQELFTQSSKAGQEGSLLDEAGEQAEKQYSSMIDHADKSSRESLARVQQEFDAKAKQLASTDPRELLSPAARDALRDSSQRTQAIPPEGPAVTDFGEIFRFDIIPRWIIGRWGTVNRSVVGGEFEAFRVPVVTGKQPSDLTGSLTYYFDANDVVQRIAFLGSTYDEKRLVEFMTSKYQLKKEPALGPDLYGVRWSKKLRSAMVIDFDANIAPGQSPKMLVRFELNRPRGGNYGLSEEFAALLAGAVKSGPAK
jgi:hypothetical protein